MIRNAKIEDVKQIHNLLNKYAREGVLLGRSISSLFDKLRDFIVFVDKEDNLLGVCALQITWENLAEVRSLAVAKDAQGTGIGRQLVESCLKEAGSFGIEQVFTLTYEPGFFRKMGFVDIDKKDLPHKIWSDCINCPMFPDCDEEALIFTAKSKG